MQFENRCQLDEKYSESILVFQELNKKSLMVEEAIEDIIILVQKMSFQKSLDYQNSFTDGGLDGE